LVEDDRATCGALGAIFRRRGWDVTTASTVAKALALLPTAPACVVLDLMLPHGNGVWLLRSSCQSIGRDRSVLLPAPESAPANSPIRCVPQGAEFILPG
jgi:DNA-binding response OmpR family regulator